MSHAVPEKAGRREWIGLGVLSLPTLLVSINVFLLLLAIPQMSQALGASSVEQLWILDIYGFTLSGLMITMGTLGDRLGHRKLLIGGGVAFGLVSILAAFSTNPLMLIIARALLGIAAATLAPSALALIRHMFKNARQRATAISIWLMCFVSGAILGPILGGAMLEYFWWGSVFLIGVPVALLLPILGPRYIMEDKPLKTASRLDMPSVGLSLVSILAIIYSLKEFAHSGFSLPLLLILLAGLVLGGLFIRRQRHLADPLLDLKLFKSRPFSIALSAMLLGTMLMGATMVFITQYLQLVGELSPLKAGVWMVPAMLGSIVSFYLAPILARKIRPAYLIAAGLAISVGGLLLISQTESVVGMIIGFALTNLGAGPLVTLGTGLVVGLAPHERAGSAAAISETSNEFGFALGIAIIGSFGLAVYRGAIEPALAGLPAEAAKSAGDTLGGALQAASNLSPEVAASLSTAARTAFTDSVHAVAFLSLCVMVVVAIVIAKVLRHLPPISDESHE